jgi:hypothetical protein
MWRTDTLNPLLGKADGYDYYEFNKTAGAAADIYYCPETNRHYVPTIGGLCRIDVAEQRKYIKLIEQGGNSMRDYRSNREKAQYYKEQYPAGTKIELISMDDPYRDMPVGLKGIVTSVDDACQIHCAWENGSSLALIPGEDRFRIVREQEQTAEGEQSEQARESEDEDELEM